MTPYLAAQHGEAVFLVSTLSGGAEKLFVQNAKRSEFVCLERACAILRDAGRLTGPAAIVDVGAHIGTTTIPALTRHGFARAVAVEPDPDNIRLLRVNVALNRLHERVTVIQAAVSDTPRKQMLWSPGSEEGGWARGRLIDEPSTTAVVIDTVTLDGLAEAGIIEPADEAALARATLRREPDPIGIRFRPVPAACSDRVRAAAPREPGVVHRPAQGARLRTDRRPSPPEPG